MPPRLNNEYYQMQNAKDRTQALRQNYANTAGASVSAGAAGGITSDAGWDVYTRMREQGRLPLPNDSNLHAQQGYATKPDGTPRFFTQEEINAMPMGPDKSMAMIARRRMTIPDLEEEYNWKQDELRRNAHVTPELKPNPANQNRPIRTTPYEFLPEHDQHNLKQVFGDKFVDVYNQADPRFRKYISGLTMDFGVRNAAEILMNPDHPRNMMHTFRGKPDKDGNVNDPAWLNDFHQNGVKKNPTNLQGSKFPSWGGMAHIGPGLDHTPKQPSAPAPAAAPKPALSPENENFLAGLQKKFDDRMAAHDADARARGVDIERVKNEGRMMGNIPPAPPAPPELSEAQQQMAQSLKAAQRRLTGADDFEPDPENPLALRPKPQPKPEKLKNDFGFSKFKQTNPKPPALDLNVNTEPKMPQLPGLPDGSLASKIGSMSPLFAKPFDQREADKREKNLLKPFLLEPIKKNDLSQTRPGGTLMLHPEHRLFPQKMGDPKQMNPAFKNKAYSTQGATGDAWREHMQTARSTPPEPAQAPQVEAPKVEAPKPVQVKPLNPSAPKRPGILGGLRRRK